MPVPTYVESGTTLKSTTGGTPGMPAGWQPGDLLLLTCMTANQTVATPSGWTEVTPQVGTGTAANAAAVRLAVFRRIAQAGDTGPTMADVGDVLYATIRAYRGVDQTTPIDVTSTIQTAASSTAVSMPAVTTTGADRLIYHCVANTTDTNTAQVNFASWSNAALTNFQDIGGDNTNVGTGGGLSHLIATKATAGSTGTTTATLATASAQAKITIAIKGVDAQSLSRTASDTVTIGVDAVDGIKVFIRSASDAVSGLTEAVARFYKNSFGGGGGGTPTRVQYVLNNNGDIASTSVSTGAITAPTSGNRLLLGVNARYDSQASGDITLSGWTLLTNGFVSTPSGAPDSGMWVFTRVADGTEGTGGFTVTIPSALANIAFVEMTAATLDVDANAASPATATTPGTVATGTRTSGDQYIVGLFHHNNNARTSTEDGDLNEVARTVTTSATNAQNVRLIFSDLTTSGDTASKTHSHSQDTAIAWTIWVGAFTGTGGGGGEGEGLPRIASDTLSISDAVTRGFIFARSVVDSITTSDAVVAVKVLVRTLTDTAEFVSDSVARVANKIRTTADTTSLSDAVSRVASKIRTVADSVPIGGAGGAFQSNAFQTNAFQTAGQSDSIVAVKSIIRSAADTLGAISDSVARAITIVRSSVDTTSVTESVARVVSTVRTVADNVAGITDSVARSITVVRTALDTTTLSESVARFVSMVRSTADTTSVSESVSRIANKVRTAADNVSGVTDSVVRGAISLLRATVDSVSGGSDSVSRIANKIRTVADTTTLTESVSRASAALSRTASDTVSGISDTVSRAITFVRSATDTLAGITDSIVAEITSGGQVIFRTAADSVEGISDSVSRMLTAVRTSVDTTSVSDSVVKVSIAIRTIADTVATSDFVVRATTMLRSATDTTTITDSVSRAGLALARSATDTLSAISDGATRLVVVVRNAADSVGISDTVVRAWQGTRSAVDTLPTINDIITTGGLILRYASDSVVIGVDSISRLLTNARQAVDSVSVSDTIVRVGQYARSAVDSVSVTDFVVRLGVVVRLTAEDTLGTVTDFVEHFLNLPALKTDIIRIVARVNQPLRVFRRFGSGRIADSDGSMNVPGGDKDYEVK